MRESCASLDARLIFMFTFPLTLSAVVPIGNIFHIDLLHMKIVESVGFRLSIHIIFTLCIYCIKYKYHYILLHTQLYKIIDFTTFCYCHLIFFSEKILFVNFRFFREIFHFSCLFWIELNSFCFWYVYSVSALIWWLFVCLIECSCCLVRSWKCYLHCESIIHIPLGYTIELQLSVKSVVDENRYFIVTWRSALLMRTVASSIFVG